MKKEYLSIKGLVPQDDLKKTNEKIKKELLGKSNKISVTDLSRVEKSFVEEITKVNAPTTHFRDEDIKNLSEDAKIILEEYRKEINPEKKERLWNLWLEKTYERSALSKIAAQENTALTYRVIQLKEKDMDQNYKLNKGIHAVLFTQQLGPIISEALKTTANILQIVAKMKK